MNDQIIKHDWISSVSDYHIGHADIEKSLLHSRAVRYDTIDMALTNSGIWVQSIQKAIELIMLQIEHYVPIAQHDSFNDALTDISVRTGCPISHIITPTRMDHRIVLYDTYVKIDETESLDTDPFHSDEVILLANDPERPTFQMCDNYLCFRSDWKQQIIRWPLGE